MEDATVGHEAAILPSTYGRHDKNIRHLAVEASKSNLSSSDMQQYSQPLHRSLGLLLVSVCIYSVPIVCSWVVTCILTFRPIDSNGMTPSWATARDVTCLVSNFSDNGDGGSELSCGPSESTLFLSAAQLSATSRWRLAAKTIGSVMAVLTLPFTSFICARAAVVYTQNRSNHGFSLRKLLVLSDRGWLNPITVSRLLLPRGWHQYGSLIFLYAFAISAIGGLIWPLQQLFVEQVTILVPLNSPMPVMLLEDADITGLSQIQSIMTVGDTIASMNYGSRLDSQPNIWRTPDSRCNFSMSWTESCSSIHETYGTAENDYDLWGNSTFISAAVNSMTTGVLEGHSFRFNTSVFTEAIAEDAFPETCSGPGSFYAATVANLSDIDPMYQIPESAHGMMEFKVCGPGDTANFPWNFTRNRQDIEEEVYIQFNSVAMSFLTNGSHTASWTQRTSAKTTAGYFILPNYENNYQPGPLLNVFDLSASNDPVNIIQSGTGMNTRWFNKSEALGYEYPNPAVVSSPALGPLLTATMALFGPSTFFSTRANSTPTLPNITSESLDQCSDPVPFSYITYSYTSGDTPWPWRYKGLGTCASQSQSTYFNDLAAWLGQLFANYDYPMTMSVFTQGAFYANKANLLQASTVNPYRRSILMDEGTAVEIFKINQWAMVLISLILALHILGLFILSAYAGWNRTWTDSLDAFAMLRIGADIAERQYGNSRLPLFDDIRESEIFRLDQTEG